MSNPTTQIPNKMFSTWHTGRDIAVSLDEALFADDDDIAAQILESSSEFSNAREKGKFTASTCGRVIYMTDPRTGASKIIKTSCGNCLRCRQEKAQDIIRGLLAQESWHGGYAFKNCNNKEAKRIMSLLGKDNCLRFPIGSDTNFLIMSRRLMGIKHEPVTKSQAVTSIMELNNRSTEGYIILAEILGDKPLDKRSSGALHRSTAAEAFDAFSDTDDFEFIDEDATFELEDLLQPSQEITYYGITIQTNSPISIERIGSAAQLEALEKTIDDIPETLEDVQRILNKRKDLFLAAVTFVAEMTGLEVEIHVKHFKTQMLPSEIAWSEKLNRETATRIRRNMNCFSDPNQFIPAGQLEDAKVPVPI